MCPSHPDKIYTEQSTTGQGHNSSHAQTFLDQKANATYVFNHTRFYLPMNEPSRNNSIHGLLWNKTMSIVASAADDVHAFVRLEYTFNQEGVVESGVFIKQRHRGRDGLSEIIVIITSFPVPPGYPFRVRVQVDYNLTDTDFRITHRATNLELHWPAPFFDSCHPYFMCNVSTSFVIFDPCTQWNHVRRARAHSRLPASAIHRLEFLVLKRNYPPFFL